MTRRENLDPDLVVRARSGDRKAMEVLVDRMTPIVSGRAWRMVQGSHHEFDDCFQAGMEAVLACVHTYDPKKGSFETWAFSSMSGSMSDSLGSWGPSVPPRMVRRYRRVLAAAEGDLRRCPEIARELGMSPEAFQAVHEALTGTISPYSFTMPGPTEARFEIEDPEDIEEGVATRLLAEAFLDLLDEPVDREIVERWVGMRYDPQTDQEISDALGIPRSTVAFRRTRALAKMKEGSHE